MYHRVLSVLLVWQSRVEFKPYSLCTLIVLSPFKCCSAELSLRAGLICAVYQVVICLCGTNESCLLMGFLHYNTSNTILRQFQQISTCSPFCICTSAKVCNLNSNGFFDGTISVDVHLLGQQADCTFTCRSCTCMYTVDNLLELAYVLAWVFC